MQCMDTTHGVMIMAKYDGLYVVSSVLTDRKHVSWRCFGVCTGDTDPPVSQEVPADLMVLLCEPSALSLASTESYLATGAALVPRKDHG